MVVVVGAVRMPLMGGCRVVVVCQPHPRCRLVEDDVLVCRRHLVVFVLAGQQKLYRLGPHRSPEVPVCRSRRHCRSSTRRPFECGCLLVLHQWASVVGGCDMVLPVCRRVVVVGLLQGKSWPHR